MDVIASYPQQGHARLDAAALVARLRARGHRLALHGDGVRVTPALPPDLRVTVIARKREVLEYLSRRPWSADTDQPLPSSGPPAFTFPIDWQQEYRDEMGILALRLHGCRDPEVRAMLRGLIATPAPTGPEAWLELGRKWQAGEHDLRRQGRLPTAPWPLQS